MTIKELINCIYDYETCVDHSCAECSAYQRIKFEDGKEYYPCQLFNVLQFGQLVKKEEEN